MDKAELLWKQYNLYIELYKNYLELVIKFNAFYYVITGAILSFYFSKLDLDQIKFSLLVPIILSVGFGFFFFYGAGLVKVMRQNIHKMRDALEFYSAPEVIILNVLLRISGTLYMLIAIGLILLLIFGNSWFPPK